MDQISLIENDPIDTGACDFDQLRSRIPKADDEYVFGGQKARKALWRTLLCDKWKGIRITRPGPLIDGKIVLPPSTEKQKRRLKIYISEDPSYSGYYRNFFHTRNGLIGIASFYTSSGDSIVVLLDGLVPYVLRKDMHTTNDYLLVGD